MEINIKFISVLSLCVRVCVAVLGVREAASEGRWFSETPCGDLLQAEYGEEGTGQGQEHQESVEYWIYQWFALR